MHSLVGGQSTCGAFRLGCMPQLRVLASLAQSLASHISLTSHSPFTTCFHLYLPSPPNTLFITFFSLYNMAPYNSLRDPFAGSQIHSRSVYPDTTRHHRSSGNPMLMSASMRAASSPRLVHGNSPLLNAVNVTPVSEEIDTFASPGQFSDAELDKEASECRVASAYGTMLLSHSSFQLLLLHKRFRISCRVQLEHWKSSKKQSDYDATNDIH